MDATILTEMEGFEAVQTVAGRIARLLCAKKIYLYNYRISSQGRFTSFKLAVVAETGDKREAECRVYREVDSDIPFDTLLYTPAEWEALSGDAAAFANHILEAGMVVYEQA